MKPFLITDGAKRLVGEYLSPESLRETLQLLGRDEKHGLLRLWISEGIPFAFQDLPLLYEAIRGWLATQLSLHPKVITMIGSARIGYSLAPLPDFGRSFQSTSDLDLTVIAESLFSQLKTDFQNWKKDITDGIVVPRSSKEERYWSDTLQRVPSNISRGFIDPHKIPALYRYSTVQRVRNIQWLLNRKIALTPGAPQFSHASLRVYRDWKSFLDQMELNLHCTLVSFLQASARTQH